MFGRLFRRSRALDHESPLLAAVAPLSGEHRAQTDSVIASLVRNGVLFHDEFDVEEVYEHVRCNGPEDPGDPVGFDEVIGSVAHTLEPFSNLVFIPVWSELTPAELEEFTESICWLAGTNTSAIATPSLDRHVSPAMPLERSDPASFTLRFELDPGQSSELEVRMPAKGIPEGLVDGLAKLLDDRLGPRRIVEALCGGDCVVSALDPATMATVNIETQADFRPSH